MELLVYISNQTFFSIRVTLWTLSLRQPLSNSSRLHNSVILFCFNLNNEPSCHSLSKSFWYLKKKKLRNMSYIIGSNWHIQKPSCRKPGGCLSDKFLFSKKTKRSLKINSSTILLHIGKRETSLSFVTVCLLFFMYWNNVCFFNYR